jgi:hypothetical protein
MTRERLRPQHASEASVNHPPDHPGEGRASGLLLHLAVLVGVALLVFAGLRHVALPSLPPGDRAAGEFSATRAIARLGRIAEAPHPLGTAEHERVRTELLAQLAALGLAPQEQTGTVVVPGERAVARVGNVLARMPGTVPGKALLLSAHYDSVPAGPGAADDGASVAAILETLRALKAGPPLRDDVIVLFTDGEEAGMLGAHLFAMQHPWARDVGLALNFEYRGNTGPIWMFETSDDNGRLIAEWQAALPHALGSSLLYEAYRAMPNDTDLTVFKAKFPGMNFAAGEGYNSYHTSLDALPFVDAASVQQQGDMMLALVRRLGNEPLAAMMSASVVYFDMPGAGLSSYGFGAALAWAVVVLALFGVVATLAAKDGQARAGRIAKAALAVSGACLALAALSQLAWLAVRQIHPGYQLLLHGSTYNGDWYLAAFGISTAAAFAWILRRLRARFSRAELVLGALGVDMAALVASLVAAPGASFLFTWPALTILLALLVLARAPRIARSETARTLLLLAAAVPALLLFIPTIHLLYFALTPLVLAATILVASLLYCVTTPLLLELTAHPLPPRGAFLTGIALFAGGAWTSGFDAQRPQPDNLLYVQQEVAGPAYLVSEDQQLDTWTRPLFGTAPKKQVLAALFGPTSEPRWTATTTPQFGAAPVVDLLSDRTEGALRHVVLSVHSTRAASRLVVSVDGLPVQQASVQGQPYTLKPNDRWRVNAYAMGNEPVRLDLTLKSAAPFVVRARDMSYGLPPGVSARPPGMIGQPFTDTDTAQVSHVVRFQ